MNILDHTFVAMGGPCRIRVEARNAKLARDATTLAEAEVRRLEFKYSRYLQDSVTSDINRSAGAVESVRIDAETVGLLNYAQTLWHESAGLFDLTCGVLRKAWDFKSGQLPLQDDIDKLLPLVDWNAVCWDESSIRLPKQGMEIDFGGCVKEYASDAAAAVLSRVGVSRALVDLSGDMAAVCDKSESESESESEPEPWVIGIRDPANKTEAVASVALSRGGLASSGDYERCMEINGTRYGHILNPITGWPLQGGLLAVSVIAPQCLVAGSAATIAMLKPSEEALSWLAQLGVAWLAVDREGAVHGTIQ
jgi:thiamine biosynthesis lipoprotein